MAVRCAVCGEDLLGAVNRCWRCGSKMEARSGETDLPPVRQAPPPAAMLPEILPDEEIAEATMAVGPSADGPPNWGQPAGPPGPAGVRPTTPRRTGSPFAASNRADAPVAGDAHRVQDRRRSTDRRDAAAGGSALASLGLGTLALICSWFTVGALFFALVGIPAGIWGLYSGRRNQAIVGLLLCCAALAISGFQAVVLFYELRYGFKPWAAPPI